MKFAFILDQLESIEPHKDSSYAMICEAVARNHQIFVVYQKDLVLINNTVKGFARLITLTASQDKHWYQTGDITAIPLQEFDAVLMRKDPPFDMEYIYSTYLLELAEDQGAYIINSPRSIRDHNEKLAIAKYPQFIAPTLISRQEALLREFLDQYHDVIFKPLDGMGGAGVFRVHDKDHNISVILETLTHYGTRTIMAQRYIPEIAQGDKRILLIAGKAVPYSLARIPKTGETRGNLAAGGTGITQPLTANDKKIAETLGPELYVQGLMLVGLDVIGEFLTEINVTSPTGMQEITQQTGFNVAKMMIDVIEEKISNISKTENLN